MPRGRLIFLVGYMACGKTTLGRALCGACPGFVRFVDLDEYIERQAGMSVKRIFAVHGEAAFRRMESEAISAFRAPDDEGQTLIVACGGGTPCHADNMDRLLRAGTVVWLSASFDRTVARLLDAGDSRPLVAGKKPDELRAFVADSLEARRLHYARAHAVFDSSFLDNEAEIASSVSKFIKQFLS